jgi:hypothetical protein
MKQRKNYPQRGRQFCVARGVRNRQPTGRGTRKGGEMEERLNENEETMVIARTTA